MNLIEEFKTVTKRIQSIEEYLNNEDTDSKEHKAAELVMKAFGGSKESMELELEGLKITEAWLRDTITHYVDEEGLSWKRT